MNSTGFKDIYGPKNIKSSGIYRVFFCGMNISYCSKMIDIISPFYRGINCILIKYITDYQAINEDTNWSGFYNDVSESISRSLWRKAADHYHGKGREHGADLTRVRSQIRQLERKGLFDQADRTRAFTTASCWTRARLFAADIGDSATCR